MSREREEQEVSRQVSVRGVNRERYEERVGAVHFSQSGLVVASHSDRLRMELMNKKQEKAR